MDKNKCQENFIRIDFPNYVKTYNKWKKLKSGRFKKNYCFKI